MRFFAAIPPNVGTSTNPPVESNTHMNAREVANLIERFLDGKSLHPAEWNEFVDVSQHDKRVDVYRRRCNQLDPLVNRPGEMDPKAAAELRSMIDELRNHAE